MSSETTVWLITGASRGIGLELVRQVSGEKSATVFAAVRTPETATKLNQVKASAAGEVHVIKMDTGSEESIIQASKEIESLLNGRGIDYVLNNAAITAGNDRAFTFKTEDLTDILNTNVTGPAIIGRTFVHLLLKSKKKTIVNFTSGLSSFQLDFGAINFSYTISKTAINMVSYKQAKENKDLTVITLDPGYVKTDMGGENAVLEIDYSVKNILNTVTSLTPQHSGKFLNYDGKEKPW